MEETIVIRGIQKEDAAAIQRIRTEILPGGEDVDFQTLVDAHVAGGTSFVAQCDGEVVGYIIGTILYAGFGVRKTAWITSIGIHPSSMGHGIGIKLVSRICETFKEKGINAIHSSVMWDSFDALSFFRKLGFNRSEFINLKMDL